VVFSKLKKTMFSSACKTALEKNICSKKSKISVFFTKNFFSQKLDFREKQTNYRQIFLKLKSIEQFLQNNANRVTFGQKITELG
jgi:hypothetical protein